MLNVLFAADFPIAKTGIASTATSILAEDVLGPTALFSFHPLLVNGTTTNVVTNLGDINPGLIFTHTEYTGLPDLHNRYPEAIFHVGDWPLTHWGHVRRVQSIKGTLGTLRSLMRLRRIDRDTRLAFVTKEDCACAVTHGFSKALHLPIGVTPPVGGGANRIDVQSICFSGNFRYQPNRDAALRLFKLRQAHFPHLRLIFAGFYADDFAELRSANVEIHTNLPSITEFLAARRPLYVSLIETGAGAKNKILEAMVAGCPIICTPESLDSSIPAAPSIKIASRDDEIISLLRQWISPTDDLDLLTNCDRLASYTSTQRSWRAVALQVLNQIADHSNEF